MGQQGSTVDGNKYFYLEHTRKDFDPNDRAHDQRRTNREELHHAEEMESRWWSTYYR